MSKPGLIKGFSKLSASQKVDLLMDRFGLDQSIKETVERYLHPTDQVLFDDISENTISNFYLPFGLAPNFLINGKMYMIPMVIEESSVVAAASKAAGFWALHGGFKTRVINQTKNGQIFFQWKGTLELLKSQQEQLTHKLIEATKELTANMKKRGGGITGFELLPVSNVPDTFQLLVKFETADSMGANFINSCLEQMAPALENFVQTDSELCMYGEATIVMCILSNYTPECLVECTVECPIENLAPYSGSYSPHEFADRFETAVRIAIHDPYRAVTHNKGIFNGIDALVLATGNDFRAIEAGAHAYASRNGQYASLTNLEMHNHTFKYTLTLPLALGTIGGLTNIHPLAKASLEILGHPSANELMQLAAATGMANNFSAVASLVTTGIQKGHMKLHLTNILNALKATSQEKELATSYFNGKQVSYSGVESFIKSQRSK